MVAFAVLLTWTPDQTIEAFGKCPKQSLPTFFFLNSDEKPMQYQLLNAHLS